MRDNNDGKDNFAAGDGNLNKNVKQPDDTRQNDTPGGGLKYVNAREAAKGGVLGAFIGLAIIIPGVSGSAVAIILKLYEKLLHALGNLFRQFKSCALFLLPIIAGAVVGFALGFFGVKILLDIMLFAVVALFAGLMLGALPSVTDEIHNERHTPIRIALFVAGILVPIALSLISVYCGGESADFSSPAAYDYIIYLLLGFAVAITQLVPGLSATALLMATGHYVPLIESVSIAYWQTNPAVFAVYACLIAGFVAGLLCFAKLMSRLLKHYRAATFHAVTGLAIGSVITMFFNPEMLNEYRRWAAGERFGPDLALGAVLFLVGITVAYLFVRMQRKNTQQNN